MNESYSNRIKQIQNNINSLKKQKNAILFTHNYQRPEIQEIGDRIGDSLYLAKEIRIIPPKTKVIYAAVKFMAETAAILNPDVSIYFPVPKALCPMAAYCTPQILENYKINNPNTPIVLYINSTAASKVYADVICTSSNAVEICDKISKEYNTSRIGFGPDKNLAKFVKSKLDLQIDILPEEGNCYVHNNFTIDDVTDFRFDHPEAQVIVHPECPPEITTLADFVGSTAAMYNYVRDHPKIEFGIGTEIGLIDRLQREYPKIIIHPLNKKAVCYTMKKYTLEAIEDCLLNIENEEFKIAIPPEIAEAAAKPIHKMFDLMEN